MTATFAPVEPAMSCPVQFDDAGLRPADRLRLAHPKRMVVQYLVNDEGQRELHLFYGDRQISFDEPELFSFGETLARQSEFRADGALAWGEDYSWPQIRDLLSVLIDEEVLLRADEALPLPEADRSRPSPLAPARFDRPRHWDDCEAITEELTGVPVEKGYLELILPVFRVAHAALDADGRQVGEANVFPRALRLDVPTDWVTCLYSGTRYAVDRPMNLSALKAMRAHWPQMMAALRVIRSAYLARFPGIDWTIGRLERLATLVLAVPTYQLMREDVLPRTRVLHPVLSSVFRVTDGLRMALHQMLFVPIGEPARSPYEIVTVDEIHDYAERNYSFHSETGVCAGPKHMVREFLDTLVHGKGGESDVALDAEVARALADIDAAFDYGLLGLQAHAAVFSVYPAMARCYAQAAEISAAAVASGVTGLTDFADRMAEHVVTMERSTFLAREDWRREREAVYADMFDASALVETAPPLQVLLRTATEGDRGSLLGALTLDLAEHFSSTDQSSVPVARLAACFMDFLMKQRAILRVATACQARINSHLGRSQPTHSFGSAEMNVHTLLQGTIGPRLPWLIDELAEAIGFHFTVDSHRITWTRRSAPVAMTPEFGRPIRPKTTPMRRSNPKGE